MIGGRRPPGTIGTFQDLGEESEFRFRCCSASMWRSAFLGPKRTSSVLGRGLPARHRHPCPLRRRVSEARPCGWLGYGEIAPGRSVEFQTRLPAPTSIEEPFRRRGPPGQRGVRGSAPRGSGPCRSVRRVTCCGRLFRRHSEVFQAEHMFDHVETALEDAGVHTRSPGVLKGVCSWNLTGYTKLTEESGTRWLRACR